MGHKCPQEKWQMSMVKDEKRILAKLEIDSYEIKWHMGEDGSGEGFWGKGWRKNEK